MMDIIIEGLDPRMTHQIFVPLRIGPQLYQNFFLIFIFQTMSIKY